ncbi:MAG: hypothetical protein WD118_11495 [Phycisphaeraceae bacterium]
MRIPLKFSSIRPLVRYVDQEQAVVDAQFHVVGRFPHDGRDARDRETEVFVEIYGSDGFRDESRSVVRLNEGTGSVRVDLVYPQRWWPAGMGEQSLYELVLSLGVDGDITDRRAVTLGLTSVRPEADDDSELEPRLLVNGQTCPIRNVLMVDRIDESQLLPATGDSLLVVRDHYGPDLLYQAADRAGILLVQSVPLHPTASPELDVAAQVDRLSPHPSLAGWFVGHLGGLSDDLACRLRGLDPTRSVFRQFPLAPVA